MRPDPRFRKRLPCRIRVDESRYSGIVLNLSRTGLFVQTAAAAPPGGSIELELRGEAPLQARVVWLRRVPQQLRSVSQGGIGVRIVGAPESYYHLLVEAAVGSPS